MEQACEYYPSGGFGSNADEYFSGIEDQVHVERKNADYPYGFVEISKAPHLAIYPSGSRWEKLLSLICLKSKRQKSAGATDECLEQIFVGLREKWQRESAGFSSTIKRYNHPSYKTILALGPDAIPLILNELKERPDWWFEALNLLVDKREHPVRPNQSFSEAVDAWLRWGREKQYIR